VRSIDIFRDDADRFAYLGHLRTEGERWGVEFLAWCLMTNHVHFVAVPAGEMSLALCFGTAHKRCSRMVNFRNGWRGFLFQGRFASSVLDEAYTYHTLRYVLRNPVRAGLCRLPWRYEWSSARFHLDGRAKRDPLVRDEDRTLLGLVDDRRGFLADGVDEIEVRRIERALTTGRPAGSDEFVRGPEKRLGQALAAGPPGWTKGRERKWARRPRGRTIEAMSPELKEGVLRGAEPARAVD
jgi:putative transposase